MALDKLVDSAQLDSDLEDVADAIRAKSGGSSPLAFPAGFKSEIGNIPSGSGAGIVVDSGTFTLASATSTHTINHNIGDTPDYIVCYADSTVNAKGIFTSAYLSKFNAFTGTQFETKGSSLLFPQQKMIISGTASNPTIEMVGITSSSWGIKNVTSSSFDFGTNSETTQVLPNVTYKWKAIKFAEFPFFP